MSAKKTPACAWCGSDLPAGAAGAFCSSTCEREAAGGAPPFTPDQLARVTELAAAGASQVSMRRAVGLGADEWAPALREFPELVEAVELGRAMEHDELVAALHGCVAGGGAAAERSARFLLATKHGYQERGPEAPATNVAVLVVPRALSVDEWQAMILREREEKAIGPGGAA